MQTELFLQAMGKRISQRRRQLKMTQEILAEKMDVSIQMISYVETGKKAIRPENLAKMCEALQISSDYLLLGRTSPAETNPITKKLDGLSYRELTAVESIIDNCLLLADRNKTN